MKTHIVLFFTALLMLMLVGAAGAQDATLEVTPEATLEATAEATAEAIPAPIRSYDADVPLFTLEHDGLARTYGLYVPSTYNADNPAPLLVALRGRFSSAKAFHAITGLAELAEARGALIAYPETVEIFWNDGGHEALERDETPHDDAGFIGAMVSTIRREYAVDTAQLYLAGYDNGGNMAYRLACEGVAPFAGVAIVSALMWNFAVNSCPTAAESHPVPMLILHGRQDVMYPVEGGAVEHSNNGLSPLLLPQRLSVADTVGFWRRWNQCGTEPTTQQGSSMLFTGCEFGDNVAYVGIESGGHDWFHTGDDYQLNQSGISATEAIDGFFFDGDSWTLPTETPNPTVPRHYVVYAPPSYDPVVPMPVVIVLHGRPSSAVDMAWISDMNSVAEKEGFVVVYPDGLNNEWNSIGDLIGSTNLVQDDVGFLDHLMDDLSVDLNLDPERMYVSGFSNGGFMTLRMACSAPERFAAFAEVGSTLYPWMDSVCRGSEPVPLLMMHGTHDMSIPFDGIFQPDASGNVRQVSLTVPGTLDYFATHNDCDSDGEQTDYPQNGEAPDTRVVRFVFRCADHADVVFYLIVNGGHNWPGVPDTIPESIAGTVNTDINAGEEIWAFFKQHTLHETG